MRVCCRVAHVRLSAGLWARRASDGGCRARRPCARFCQEASDPQSASRFQASAGRRGDRRRRYLHAPRVACGDDRRGHASGKARHLREAVHRIFRTRRRRGSDRQHVPKSLMYERVMEEMDKTCAAIKSSGRLFMYAEDWVYAPAVAKTVEILKATKDKILFMKAEESHSGSHAAHAAQWSTTGGGSLIRMGCHPLSTVLYLKQVEAKARGERIAVSGVTADVGNVAACLPRQERPFINANPVDVEDWGMLTLTF